MEGSQNRRTPDPEAKEHRELPVNTALASATDMGGAGLPELWGPPDRL